jgi:hypothetical protein
MVDNVLKSISFGFGTLVATLTIIEAIGRGGLGRSTVQAELLRTDLDMGRTPAVPGSWWPVSASSRSRDLDTRNGEDNSMKTSFRMLTLTTLSAFLLLANCTAMAEDQAENRKADGPTVADQQSEYAEYVAYLGVSIERLHPSLWSHLSHLFDREQGVWVTGVAVASPAETAGLQKHDIVLTYDDQKIYSPEQLAKLVRADKAGREVTLGIVRQGKSQQVKVTLGERVVRDESSVATLPRPWLQMPEWFSHKSTPQEKDATWDNFDSMTLTRLGLEPIASYRSRTTAPA